MNQQQMVLNIRYDAPQAVWDKMESIYSQLNGWLGFGKGGNLGEKGIPYWFSYKETEKHISASIEPGGLQFSAFMNDEEWLLWIRQIKNIATKELGFNVEEIESGEVED